MRKINLHDFHFFDRALNVSNRRIVPTLIHRRQLISCAGAVSPIQSRHYLHELITEGLIFQSQPAESRCRNLFRRFDNDRNRVLDAST